MRTARLEVAGRGTAYHCISRVVGGQMLVGSLEKEKLREMLWQQAEFSGVEIVTYCLRSSHIHVLVRVPAEVTAPDEELVARALKSYGKKSLYVQTLQKCFNQQGALPADLREGLRQRMGDVSAFIDGVVLGSRNYVNGVFTESRDRFGPRRKTGARRMRGLAGLGELTTMRDLQVNAVGWAPEG